MLSVDWSQVVDGYCERTDSSYWSEPLNALSNVSFLVAAVVCWRIAGGDRQARLLAAGAAIIGIGSFHFHTYATLWASQADVLPIKAFTLLFVALAARRMFNATWLISALAAVGFVAVSWAVVRALHHLVGHLHGSTGYLPIPLLLVVVSSLLWRQRPNAAGGLLACASVFSVSLALRIVDLAVCPAWPWGTHFAWHLLNGVVIGWLIVLFIRAGGGEAPLDQPRVA